LANGKYEAGALGTIIIYGFTVEILEAQGNAIRNSDPLGRCNRLALDGNTNETIEGSLLTARG
jgi:hypothetical protein